jgi:hypothetical protein
LYMGIDAVHFHPSIDASKYLFMGKTIMTHPNLGMQVVATSNHTAYAVVSFIGNLLMRSNVTLARDTEHAIELIRNKQKPILMLDIEKQELEGILDRLINTNL